MSADVGQAFQPAGSADFPVRRDARVFGAHGMSAPSWGLTVPGTGRLESLPYKGWRRRARRSWVRRLLRVTKPQVDDEDAEDAEVAGCASDPVVVGCRRL